METLIIKIQEPKKVQMLIELLKSMNFISSVDNFDNYLKAKDAFHTINDFATQTALSELTMEDIISEIKMYRNEKNYVVIDTNVFISAIIGQNNFPRKIFDEIILINEVKICLSAQVLAQ